MTEDRTFNWIRNFDEKSKEYPIRATIETRPTKRNKLWRIGPILDQGREGACVGFGWAAEAFSTPVSVDLSRVKADVPRDPTTFAQHIYRSAQKLDEWPGEAYSGSSVNAGAKAMRDAGLIKEYRWAFSIEDVTDSVLTKGPVVIGTNWYNGMYYAPNGVLRVGGELVGGHCYTIVGYRLAESSKTKEDAFIVQNSWGADWGTNGLAEIKVSDMRRLLIDERGEACVPSKRSYGR